MAGEIYLVPTDAEGAQRAGEDVTKWPLPVREPDGTLEPGAAIEPQAGTPIVLHDLDGLLDELGERIFLAEALEEDSGAATRARLVSETSWNLHEAARFALDCAEHVITAPDELRLPSGASLADILAEARARLDEEEQAGTGLLERISRLALARRLRHASDDVADLALLLTAEDEGEDLDALDDPHWTAVAAIRDAGLSAVEAIRHDALPRLFESENRRYEGDAGSVSPPSEIVSTPWGNFAAGGWAGVVPAFVAARDAAERARQAAADAGGQEAGEKERAWQRERLAAALGLR